MTSIDRRLELVTTGALGGIGALAVLMALSFPAASRVIPTAIGSAMLLVALVQGVLIARKPSTPKEATATVDSEPEDPEAGAGSRLLTDSQARRRTLTIILISVLLIATIPIVGFPVAIGLFLLASMALVARLPLWGAASVAAAGLAITYALFELVLGIQPFTGLVFSLF